MKRSKSSLPLTRFVAPKRLTGNTEPARKIDTPTSSLTPVEEDDSTMKGTDETAENEEVEDVITADSKDMNISGSTIDDPSDPDEATPDKLHDPTAILEAVQVLHQDFIKHQNNFDEFVNEANARIIKLENSIAQVQDEEDIKCREGIQELKRLMANNEQSSSNKVYVSALSFGDFDQQQSRTRSRLSRFTQLDSEEESATPATIDPSILHTSHTMNEMNEQTQSSDTTRETSSQVQQSSQISMEEQPEQQELEQPDHELVHESPELNSDVDDLGPDSPIPSPQSSPFRPSSSASAAAACLVSIAHSEYIDSSPPTPIPQATQANGDTQYVPSTQDTQPSRSTQILEATQSTQLSPPAQNLIPIFTLTDPQAHPPANKRPRRNTSSASLPKPLLPPPSKKQKGQRGIKKPYTKRQVTGDKGLLSYGTLKKSKGIVRVKGAKWPTCGPNTVIGLGGYIECEICFGPVHRSCAGIRDNEEIPNMTWICPECDYVRLNGGTELPKVTDQTICIRHNCVRRRHAKIKWKPSDAELYVIEKSIGRRLLQPARSLSKGKYEYLTLWHGYPLNESTWEPVESFVAAEEMARQFVIAVEGEGVDLARLGEGVVLLEEAMEAFGEDGELKA